NAILSIAGNFDSDQVLTWCEQYFGTIPHQDKNENIIPDEPVQTQAREKTVEADVPLNAVWLAYHMPARFESGYYIADILSDILGSGKTALLYQEFVKNTQYFTEITCYHTGSIDNGLLVIEGKIS